MPHPAATPGPIVPAPARTRGFLRSNARWLAAGGLMALLSSFGQTFFISVFSGEIQAAFGLTEGSWGAIYTAATAAAAAVMVWAGAQADRHAVRALGTWVLMGLAFACVLMAAIPAAWMLVPAVFALRLMGQGMTSHIGTVAMARWFDAARGRALALASLGFSLGEAILPVAFVALLTVASWRSLWLLCAALILAAIPLLRALLARERSPSGLGVEAPAAPGMDGRHWKRAQVLRSGLFWAMVPTLLGPSAFVTAFFFLQVHLAGAKGWSHLELVALFPLYTVTAVGAMLAAGWAVDRFGSGRLVPVSLLPLAGAFLVVSGAQGLGLAAVGVMLMGVTSGVNATLPGAFWAEFYGTRHLGAVKAMAAAVMVLGSAIGPGLTGLLIDAGMDFERQMPAIAAYLLAASGLTALVIGRAIARLGPSSGA